MKVQTSPDPTSLSIRGGKQIFLAGSITGAWNWHDEAIKMMQKEISDEYILFNPRRNDWDENASEDDIADQIRWEEYRIFTLANRVMFWFSHETLAPITLFELGTLLPKSTKLFVGVDPEYKRKLDVEIQVQIKRPFLRVFNSLVDTVDALGMWSMSCSRSFRYVKMGQMQNRIRKQTKLRKRMDGISR